ncbi:Mss4-like protein [Apodospora peruviana]|uniref:Mss4-like protein n=1 Tax=Apodospora peruviana TaxID=516989 RepID=A0AAE0IJQ8_9PEZI|nr:Mss4-like protein [Apodospora peruviana]KAK3326190.1 Mss4-like protein [Apodospora peruviana]
MTSEINETASPSVKITAQCLCKAHTFSTAIPADRLPLRASYCHCNSCRHLTGALYTCSALWPGPSADIESNTTLKRYKFTDHVTVLFCGTCSSPMFAREVEKDARGEVSYGVCTGILSGTVNDGKEENVKNLVRIAHHMFLGDTLDGGASCWMRRPNGRDGDAAKRWLGQRAESKEIKEDKEWPDLEELPSAEWKTDEKEKEVSIRCHCGGVDLTLHVAVLQMQFAATAQKGEEELPWFVDPKTFKSIGTFDGCDSCRLSAGVDIFNWTFMLLQHISFPKSDGQDNGREFPRDSNELKAVVEERDKEGSGSWDPRLGTLTFFASSPDVQRYFCSRCSACVFYAWDGRPQMVDVAVGVLHAASGARAEGIISWSLGGGTSYREDMVGTWREELVKAVEKEADEWRVRRGYPKNWRRVLKEGGA